VLVLNVLVLNSCAVFAKEKGRFESFSPYFGQGLSYTHTLYSETFLNHLVELSQEWN